MLLSEPNRAARFEMLADALTPADEATAAAAAAAAAAAGEGEEEGDELLETTPLRLLQLVELSIKRARAAHLAPPTSHSQMLPHRSLASQSLTLHHPSSEHTQLAGDGEQAVAGSFAALLPGDVPIFQGAPGGLSQVLNELREALLARIEEEQEEGGDDDGGAGPSEYLSEVA